MGEEETLEKNHIIKTGELFVERKNEDPVTGYPFEVPELRDKLIEVIGEAIQQKEGVILITGDIDNLKGLNDLCGKGKTNEGIKKTVQEKEKVFLGLMGAKAIYTYRPQAGGDEFKILVIITEPERGRIEEIEEELKRTTDFEYKEGELTGITCSFGFSSRRFLGSESPSNQLQAMEEEAEKALVEIKTKNIITELTSTVARGGKLDLEDYIKEITKRWGTRRMTETALRVILLHLMAKAQIQMLKKPGEKHA